jgi:hypothetical protein
MRIELADVLCGNADVQRGLRLREGRRGERESRGQKGRPDQHDGSLPDSADV